MMTPEFTTDVSTAWQAASKTQIELTPAQMDAAIVYSESLPTDSSQVRWQSYLDYLAYLGLQEWFQNRGLEDCQLIPGSQASHLPLRVQIGDFQLAIVTIGGLWENVLILPRHFAEQPELASHFYVWMQVLEEEQTVAVKGFLTYPQFQQAYAVVGETCELPINAFTLAPNQLLLNLRCLDVEAIPLPVTTTNRISWPALAIPKIDVGQWLNYQIDQLAQEVGWLLMPSLATSVMRTMQGNFEVIRSSLQQQGVHIPEQAKGAYRDLTWQNLGSDESHAIRLYAVMWLCQPELSESSDWILLVVIDTPMGEATIDSIQLVVRDADQTLFDQVKTSAQNPAILYAQVMGQQHESFWVGVTVNQEHIFEIPPFGFASDVESCSIE